MATISTAEFSEILSSVFLYVIMMPSSMNKKLRLIDEELERATIAIKQSEYAPLLQIITQYRPWKIGLTKFYQTGDGCLTGS